MSRPPTIKDVARLLGLSHSTVSRALTGAPGPRPETRTAVREAAARLHYVPNTSARMMKTSRAAIVGLVVPNASMDFYSAVMRVLEAECRAASLQLMLSVTDDDPDIEHASIRSLLEARAAGIVITPTSACRPDTIALLERVPTVQIVRHEPRVSDSIVRFRDSEAIETATAHLLSLGHRDIAYIGPATTLVAGRVRLAGFRAAFAAADLPAPDGVHLGATLASFGTEAATAALSQPRRPTGMVVASSDMIPGALRAIRDSGLHVPDDLSVVVFGDPDWLTLLQPPVTAVNLPSRDLAKATAATLFGLMDGGASTAPSMTSLSPGLVVRRSTAPAPRSPKAARRSRAPLDAEV